MVPRGACGRGIAAARQTRTRPSASQDGKGPVRHGAMCYVRDRALQRSTGARRLPVHRMPDADAAAAAIVRVWAVAVALSAVRTGRRSYAVPLQKK